MLKSFGNNFGFISLEKNPNHELTLQNPGVALKEKGDTKGAEEMTDRLAKINPNSLLFMSSFNNKQRLSNANHSYKKIDSEQNACRIQARRRLHSFFAAHKNCLPEWYICAFERLLSGG